MRTFHVLNQFVWPDAAPTGVYAEQLADELTARGHAVRLVGTTGHYRTLDRPGPKAPLLRLPVPSLGRRSLLGVSLEYGAAERRFRQYLQTKIAPGDVVVVSTAPPTTPWLIGAIRRRGAIGVYWLQDYYPELIRSIWDPPAPLRRWLRRRWDNALGRWHSVLKIGANLGYHGPNAVVARNWAPFAFTPEERLANPMRPKTALYAGNLGHAHDVMRFVQGAESLRGEGYTFSFYGDGPHLGQLPAWLNASAPLPDAAALRAALLQAEVHLIAAHPDYQEALFPSKIWNSLEAGRRVIGTGFAGKMAEELRITLEADHRENLRHAARAVEAAGEAGIR